MRGRPRLAVTLGLSTVFGADQSLVLNKGRVVERGPHEDLIRQGGEYMRLYNMQFESVESA